MSTILLIYVYIILNPISRNQYKLKELANELVAVVIYYILIFSDSDGLHLANDGNR